MILARAVAVVAAAAIAPPACQVAVAASAALSWQRMDTCRFSLGFAFPE